CVPGSCVVSSVREMYERFVNGELLSEPRHPGEPTLRRVEPADEPEIVLHGREPVAGAATEYAVGGRDCEYVRDLTQVRRHEPDIDSRAVDLDPRRERLDQ